MSNTHRHALFVHTNSPLHRLAPEIKLIGALTALLSIVSTPRQAWWWFAGYGVGLLALTIVLRLPPRRLLRRMLFIAPFLLLALLFPLVGGEPYREIWGWSLSQPGLWDLWNLTIKATMGMWIAVILGGSTEVTELIRGLGRLGVPNAITTIMGFMVRYLDVLSRQITRMRQALRSRGHRHRGFRSWKPYLAAIGSLFIRSYEKGERVFLAMQARGFSGQIHPGSSTATSLSQWVVTLGIGAVFFVSAVWANLTI